MSAGPEPERLRVDPGDPRQLTHQRRGRTVTCPRCAADFETMRRFRMLCPACEYAWTERSRRNVIDWLRELPGSMGGNLLWTIPVVCLVGFLAAIVYNFANVVKSFDDFVAILPIGAFLLLLFGSILWIGSWKH
jgi:hypothetical protein